MFTGEEDRQALYPAMTRGANGNYGYFFTADPRTADPQAGTRPAAELARQRMLDQEREGALVPEDSTEAEPDGELLTAAAVAARIIERDGQQLSATEIRAAELADADRLDLLYSQWETVTQAAAQREYESAVTRVLPTAEAAEILTDPAARALWRGLREAQAAGLAPDQALFRAVAWGPLDNAASTAKVMDWRIRQLMSGREAIPRPWTEQVPPTGDEDTDRFARELAEAMDERQRRLGEHAAETQPLWARQGLGAVPAEPLSRLEWEQRAASVGAYREMWGYAHPGDPIGPRPSEHNPDARAMWQAAADALTRRDGIDLSPLSDGQLWARRAAFEREMAWAPPYPGPELETARKGERDAHIGALRADMEANAASTEELRDVHHNLADGYRLLEVRNRDHAERLALVADAHAEWEAVTERTRRYALAADAELRRRHPEQRIKPLTAVDQEPSTPVIREQVWIQPTLDGSFRLPDAPEQEAEPEPARSGQAELSPELVADYEQRANLALEKIAELVSQQLPDEDPDAAPEPAWQQEVQREREAVLQPPMPLIAQREPGAYDTHPYHQYPEPGQDEPVMYMADDIQADGPSGPETQ